MVEAKPNDLSVARRTNGKNLMPICADIYSQNQQKSSRRTTRICWEWTHFVTFVGLSVQLREVLHKTTSEVINPTLSNHISRRGEIVPVYYKTWRICVICILRNHNLLKVCRLVLILFYISQCHSIKPGLWRQKMWNFEMFSRIYVLNHFGILCRWDSKERNSDSCSKREAVT